MPKRTRTLLLILGGAALAMSLPVFALGLYIHNAGMIEVRVSENHGQGDRVSLRVPAALVEAGLVCLPLVKCCGDGDRDIAIAGTGFKSEREQKVAREVLRQIADMPDADLVTVESLDENVRIAKQGGHLKIHVQDGGDDVYVSVPVGVVRRLAAKI